LAIALVLTSLFINTILAKELPSIEGILLTLHVSGFISILVTLWTLAPHSSPRKVFTEFNDGGNWHSMGLATLVGILSPTLSLIGPDAVVHVSEEVRDASKTIPRIMLATAVANGVLGFVMLLTFCFCLGNLDDVLATSTGYPFIQVCRYKLRSIEESPNNS
jgi:choline transport protein